MGRGAVLAVVLAPAVMTAAGCYATHEYREIHEAPARAATTPDPLPVRIAMVAGELRLGKAPGDALYELEVRVCRHHFTATIAAGANAPTAVDVALRRRSGGVPAMPADQEHNSVELGLSALVPADIRLDLGSGRHRADLGGLRIAGLHVSCGSGDLDLDFSTSVQASPEEVVLEGGTGQVLVRRLGNASPGSLVVRTGGLLSLDLAGAWKRDATIDVDARLSDVVVDVPPGLGLAVEAQGRDPSDFVAPGLRQDAQGRWLTPGFGAVERRVVLRLRPGIGRFEARTPPAPG